MMRLLITGGFGYLGGRLVQHLANNTCYELFLGTRKNVNAPEWAPQARVVQTSWGSQGDLETICAGMDAVVHLAGMNAQDCVADPVAALDLNGVATARLLQAAIRQGVKRFIYLSTAHVYGSPLAGVISEDTSPENLHIYATSHRAGEEVVRWAHQRGEIEGIVIRLSNSFGAPMYKGVNCWMLLVNDLCRQAVTMKRLVLHSSGTQRRNFIALTDTCRAIIHLLQLPSDKLGDGLFNVGGADSLQIIELAEKVAESCNLIFGFMPEVKCLEEGAHEIAIPFEYRIDKLLATGFALQTSMSDEIEAELKFCQENFAHLDSESL